MAACALAAAGYALAANVTITLGPNGPQPGTVTAQWGDTLEVVNADSVAHGLTSSRTDFHADTIAPGATYTNVQTGRAGQFTFRQTGGKGASGTVVLVATGTVTLRAVSTTLLYGQAARVHGVAAPAGSEVAIEERLAGDLGWTTATTVTSGADGSFAATVPVARGGRLRAAIDGDQIRSATVALTVEPRLTVTVTPRRVAVGRFVSVRAHVSPSAAAERLTLSRCASSTSGWRQVGARAPKGGVAAFRVKVVYGKNLLRAAVAHGDAAPGYAVRTSATLAVTGTGAPPAASHHSPHPC